MNTPETVIIIPARHASSRFPGKPLASIQGQDGLSRPLIEWSHSGAARVHGVDQIYVATDDERVAGTVDAFGGQVLMTPESCRNGTERVASCLDQLPDAALFINFQGDALLTPPAYVEALIDFMNANPEAKMATVAVRCTAETYQHLAHDAAEGRVGGTTVVMNSVGEALYFSKRIIPYLPVDYSIESEAPVLLHLGLYAYRRDTLTRYMEAGQTELEVLEGLEQIRFLVHGTPVSVIVMPPPPFPLVEVNNPSDIPIVEAILYAQGPVGRE